MLSVFGLSSSAAAAWTTASAVPASAAVAAVTPEPLRNWRREGPDLVVLRPGASLIAGTPLLVVQWQNAPASAGDWRTRLILRGARARHKRRLFFCEGMVQQPGRGYQATAPWKARKTMR